MDFAIEDAPERSTRKGYVKALPADLQAAYDAAAGLDPAKRITLPFVSEKELLSARNRLNNAAKKGGKKLTTTIKNPSIGVWKLYFGLIDLELDALLNETAVLEYQQVFTSDPDSDGE